MEGEKVLLDFLQRIRDDPVIDAKHIALFMALYKRWLLNGCTNPITVKSRIIMEDAKMSSTATYFKKLKYLHGKRYIDYESSTYWKTGSKVFLRIH